MAEDRTTTRQDVVRSLPISKDDFVVEVGGGHEPFWRSDLIFDKYPDEQLHRSQPLAHAAPVMIADAVRLPLPDAACDLIFASHIIEHLPDPGRFLAEVERCASHVYLEFPAANRELMFAWSFHRWLVEVDGTDLTFYRNDVPQLFGAFFHRNYDFVLDAWAEQRHLELNSHVHCRSSELTWRIAEVGAFEHIRARSARGEERVNGAPRSSVRYTWRQLASFAALKTLPEPWLDGLVSLWRRRRRGRPREVRQDLVARLMCLECGRTALRLVGEAIVCEECGARYEQRLGLFDFDRETVSPRRDDPSVAVASRSPVDT